MKRIQVLTLALTTVALISTAGLAAEDMPDCDFCAKFAEEKGLMEHMDMEHYKVATGMMSITVVDDGHVKAYERAMAGIEEVRAKMESGEKVKMCNHCETMGALMQAGAKMDKIDTKAGHVTLLTAQNADTVAEIHDHLTHTQEMMKAYKK